MHAVITDTHLGIKNNSKLFRDNQLRFYKELLFPYLLENGITEIIHAGDLFDDRTNIGVETIQVFQSEVFDFLDEHNITLYLILGNHDVAYKNTNVVNSPTAFLKKYKNIVIIDQPSLISVESRTYMMCPWINNENFEETMSYFRSNGHLADALFGHFECKGFTHNKLAPPSVHGLSASIFEEFDQVYSGHFHTQSSSGNITYLGATSEYTWADYDDPRGFHVINESQEMKFIQNPFTMFVKLKLSHKFQVAEDNIKNKIVKLVLDEPITKPKLDKMIEEIESLSPHSFEIIDDRAALTTFPVEELTIHEEENVTELIQHVVLQTETNLCKTRIRENIMNLYQSALSKKG